MTEKRITRHSHATPATPCREKKTPSDENRPESSRKRHAEDKSRKPGKQKLSKQEDNSANAKTTPSEEYTSVVCRSSPKVLVDAIAKLNEPQKKAVEEMGLTNIMHLTIKEIPGKLAYWLLEHFHAKSCSLQLPDSKNLHFDEEDVGLTLGVPRGPVLIKRKGRHVESAILNEWISRVGKPKRSITPKDICNAMMGEADGGDWFKRHFLILMIACLFENVGSGYILPKVIEDFQQISEVKHLNWCRFVIEVLIEHHGRWERNKASPFKGPMIFLMALYVDRVIVFTRTVPRAFPAVKGWDCKAVKLRETKELHSGGFGVGHVDKRYKRVDIKNLQEMQPCKGKMSELFPQGNVSEKKSTPSREMSESMEMLMDLVDEAASEMMQNESLKKVIGASHGLLGLNTVVGSTQAEELEKSHERFYDNDVVMGDVRLERREELAPETTVEKGSEDEIDPPVQFENQNALPHESSGHEEVQEENDGDVEDTVCAGDGNPKGQEELVVKTMAKKESEHIIDPHVQLENQNALQHELLGREEMEELENQNVLTHERAGNEVVEAEVKPKPYSKRKLPLVGNIAPDFEAGAVFDREFVKVKLSEYIGKKYVVLFFYPLDFTFVCTTEIIAFSERYGEFQKLDTEILGVSTDSVFSHLAWIQRDRKFGGLGDLAYPLVSDITKSISKAYDVLIPDQGIALRGLFIIDKGGVIQHSTINNLGIERSVEETLKTLEALQYVQDNPNELCLAGWKPVEKSMKRS